MEREEGGRGQGVGGGMSMSSEEGGEAPKRWGRSNEKHSPTCLKCSTYVHAYTRTYTPIRSSSFLLLVMRGARALLV